MCVCVTSGEIRISFDAVTPTELSVIGKQTNVKGDLGDHASLKLVAEGAGNCSMKNVLLFSV